MNDIAPVRADDTLDWLHEQGKRRSERTPEFDVEETLRVVRNAVPTDSPRRHGALSARTTHPGATAHFTAHEPARSALHERSGKIVVTGPHGVGKSTLAHEAAAAHDSGYGWFLNASSRQAFDAALAEAELIERGSPLRDLEATERQGLARSALERLRRTRDPWVIVIDNANAGASDFDAAKDAVDRLPAPRDGQLIIATSTAGPEQWPGWSPVPLTTVSYGQLQDLGDPQAARLSAGRPLLWAAFTRLLALPGARELLGTIHNAGSHELGSSRDAEGVSDESARRAAALYWSVARQSLGPAAVSCAERMAWLPPDRIEYYLAGDDEVIREALIRAGMLGISPSADAVTLHRLFGEAIRAAVGAEGRAEETVLGLLARPEVQTSLMLYGDADTTAKLEDALTDTGSGLALWAVAALQEAHGGDAPATFRRAEALLGLPGTQEVKSALADCLHEKARLAMIRPSGREEIETGIADAQRAIELRDPDEQVAIAKHETILALLRRRAAGYIDDPAEKLRETYEVLRLLERSWERRRETLGPDQPEVDRAYYNLASMQIALAKLDKANAGALLAGAKEIYQATLAFRRRYYTGPNPITAASLNGIGIWGLETVKLGLADDPDAVLAEATSATVEALAMRRESGIANDIEKSAILLAKLALLQVKVSASTPDKAATAAAEVINDLELRDPGAGGAQPDRVAASPSIRGE